MKNAYDADTNGTQNDMKAVAELLRPFALSIHAKVAALQENDLTAKQSARLRESISDDIKKCTNFVIPSASQAALSEAARLQINLCSKDWHDQEAFDPGRKVFHLEHFVPVSAIRAACLFETSQAGILNILIARLRIVWVLKTEDAELTRRGFRSRRPDPEAAYRAAGIDVI